MISKPELLLDARAELAEGPAWVIGTGLLYWVDIFAGHLHYCLSAKTAVTSTSANPSAVSPRAAPAAWSSACAAASPS